jgi:hypothetical protein
VTGRRIENALLEDLNGAVRHLIETPVPPAGPPAVPVARPAPAREPALTDRQALILETMLELGATSETRRTTRSAVVAAIDPKADVENYKKALHGLGRLGYTGYLLGPDGGIWLTQSGIETATRLRDENRAGPTPASGE